MKILFILFFIGIFTCRHRETLSEICNNNKEAKGLLKKLEEQGILKSQAVASALCNADRKDFMKKENLKYAYVDRPVSIGYGATISAPHMHAFALEHFHDTITQSTSSSSDHVKVLDVGSGSGYLLLAFAKVLDFLKVMNYSIYGIDHMDQLVEMSKNNISKNNKQYLDRKKIIVKSGDGRKGMPEHAPFDYIHVGAASDSYPHTFISQLKRGGSLFIPIGEKQDDQFLYTFHKDLNDKVTAHKSLPVVKSLII